MSIESYCERSAVAPPVPVIVPLLYLSSCALSICLLDL